MSHLFIVFVFSTTRQPASANQRLLRVNCRVSLNTRHYLPAAVALCLDELVLMSKHRILLLCLSSNSSTDYDYNLN